MKRKQLLSISASVLAAAWIASDAGLVLAQSSSSEKKDKSVGGSQSERTGSDSGTPVPEKSPMGETVEKGTGSGTSKSGMKDKSVGGSQSERTGRDSDTPLPEKSKMRGSEKGASSTPASGTSQSGMKDSSSVGGSQSQRTGGDSRTPLPEGSRMGGSADPTQSSGRAAGSQQARGERWAMQDIKEAQEALKDKGHDPGSIDGRMGPKTREAIRAFQSSNGLQATGSLNAETAKKLGVEREGSSGSSRGSMDKDRSGSSSTPKDSTKRDSSAPMNK
jgi:Putative peptidoglycan binding domain